jgi:hypothetical protein
VTKHCAAPPVRQSFEIVWSAQTCLRFGATRHVASGKSGVVPGLVSGAKYWFRIRASNAHGPGPWSQLASVRVK